LAPCPVQRGQLQVTNALTKAKKTEIVSNIKSKLDDSAIVFGMRYKGLDVSKMQKLRKNMPESAQVYICKNTLMSKACTDAENWSTVANTELKGENAWVFVKEDDIAETVKAYFKFEDDLFAEAKKTAAKGETPKKPVDVSFVFMDNKLLTPAELKKCENLPTKKQVLATIAALVKTPAKQIATTVKQVPTKLAIALKKVSELDEDKTKTLAEVAKQ
jgi:large subunit ribosomal protein L10